MKNVTDGVADMAVGTELPLVALGPDSTDQLTGKDKEFFDDLEFVNRHASQFAKLVRLLRVWNKAREEYMNADRKVIGAAAEDRLADIHADARMDVERFVFGSMTLIGCKRKPNLADMVGGGK